MSICAQIFSTVESELVHFLTDIRILSLQIDLSKQSEWIKLSKWAKCKSNWYQPNGHSWTCWTFCRLIRKKWLNGYDYMTWWYFVKHAIHSLASRELLREIELCIESFSGQNRLLLAEYAIMKSAKHKTLSVCDFDRLCLFFSSWFFSKYRIKKGEITGVQSRISNIRMNWPITYRI